MKELFYSKTFKKNLAKWICMYVCAIGLFVGIITYSRYMASYPVDDTSRMVKFNVDVSYDKICTEQKIGTVCSYDNIRPTEYLDYYFKVDTSELEVDTDFVTTFIVNKEYFEDYKLYEVTDDKEIEFTTDNSNYTYKVTDNIITLTETIKAGSGKERKFKLKVRYKNYDSDNYYDSSVNITEAIVIGYSAIQVEGDG